MDHRKLVAVVSAVLRSADPPADLADFSISRGSARRARARHRAETAASVKERFVPPTHAVIHWDGKILQVTVLFLDFRIRKLQVNPNL